MSARLVADIDERGVIDRPALRPIAGRARTRGDPRLSAPPDLRPARFLQHLPRQERANRAHSLSEATEDGPRA